MIRQCVLILCCALFVVLGCFSLVFVLRCIFAATPPLFCPVDVCVIVICKCIHVGLWCAEKQHAVQTERHMFSVP